MLAYDVSREVAERVGVSRKVAKQKAAGDGQMRVMARGWSAAMKAI
jgi:hypothetical protein